MAGEHLNGVEPPRKPGRAFPLRLVSSAVPGRIELLVAFIVVGTVFGVAFLIFQLPGPLVVRVRDDQGANVMGARVSCEGPPTADLGPDRPARTRSFAGITDIFGETKWPGLEKGTWSCHVTPPDRFQGAEQDATARVRSRSMAMIDVKLDRPVHVNLAVKRPKGSPRARMAVRAICPATQTAPEAAWESRATVIGSDAVLWVPFGRACRAGLASPLRTDGQSGLVEHATLDCAAFPCTAVFSGASGASVDLAIEPTPDQWAAARPPPDPDDSSDAGSPGR